MLFLDEVTISVQGGNGGNGSVHFNREKHKQDGGPDGGHGGKGGNIKLVASKSLNTLIDFFRKKKFVAENGQGGSRCCKQGKNGMDKILTVPVGTMVFDETNSVMLYDLENDGDSCIIAHGGNAGIGNTAFKTSTNQAPSRSIPGKQGEKGKFILSMRLSADIGLIGLPNAGKSSFLKATTNAKPKIADYAFTTIEPSIGFVEVENYDGFTLADTPGIIEGASSGIGLGHNFLKHIEKCVSIIHLIDISEPDPIKNYLQTINELQAYNKQIIQKQNFVVVNKCDLVEKKYLNKIIKKLEKLSGKKIYSISIKNKTGIEEIKMDIFRNVQAQKNKIV